MRKALAAAALAAALLGVGGSAGAQQTASEVVIYRDAYGVPHIEAPTVEGLAFGTGYAQAKDRLFLTHAIRLTAQGRTAELLGPGSLEADRAMRRDFYDRTDVERQYHGLPEAIKRELQAFSDGFNRGMNEVLTDPFRRPAAFDALGHTPEPWKPTDSVSVVALFTWVSFAGEGGGGQLRNAELLARLQRIHGARKGLRIWGDVVLKNDPAAPTVSRRAESGRAPAHIRRERPGRAQRALARRLEPVLAEAAEARARELDRVREILRKVPVPKIGSYAAAIAGRRTKSGGAIVVGAPQTGITAPSIFWQLGQHGPGRDCTGFTVPGLGPWTGVGWCNGHAWSLVAGNMGEQVDHYVEEIDPDNPRRYRFNGQWRDMTVRTETIRANRCAPPVCSEPTAGTTETFEVESTVHGPVVFRDAKRGIAITVKRAQRGGFAQSIAAVVGWNEANSLSEFDRRTDAATGSYNLLYGDRDGRILYRFTGWQPIRAKGVDRRLPTPGTGGAEWRGLMPQRSMPRVVDPKSGILVANQGVESKPARWWPNSSSVAVGQITRVASNRQLLSPMGLDVQRVEEINPRLLERVDGITQPFAPHLRRALRGAPDPRLREALGLFDEWARAGYPRVDGDGDGNYDHPAIQIFGADHFNLPGEDYPRTLWSRLLDRIFADELGAPQGQEERGTYAVPGGGYGDLSKLKLVLDGRRASVRLARDYADDVRTKRREKAIDHVRASAADALAELEKRYGTRDMRRWLAPVPTVPFQALGLVAPPPIKGFDHGTYSHIVDPRAGSGRYILVPGNDSADGAPEIANAQSGRYPKHFADQREIYERYGFLNMPRAAAQYRENPESVTRLPYGG